MTAPGESAKDASRRQKRMGPAPFASFEDLSDEVRSRLDSPDDKNLSGSVVRLPGIREDTTPTPTTPALTGRITPSFHYPGISLIGATHQTPSTSTMSSTLSTTHSKSTIKTPSTPRIDISRASSSSHHDSRDSTPEREIFDSHDPHSAKLGLGFKEDGTLDLRSSTEELDFHDVPSTERRKSKSRAQSPSLHDELLHKRKDSQCSDIVLLSISGRTSRLSSIGSQGSGQSRLSNASHLSGQSNLSRCSSPHKMVLETSFCGTKPPEKGQTTTEPNTGTKIETESMEKVLLSRKHDPTAAILAEGISVGTVPKSVKLPPEKPARKVEKKLNITITVDKPVSDEDEQPKLPRKFFSKSGVEYYYIPLKGPLPVDDSSPTSSSAPSRPKLREVKSASYSSASSRGKHVSHKPVSKSATPSPIIKKKDQESEAKYIRIKLKPDHMYDDNDAPFSPNDQAIQKPESLHIRSTHHPVTFQSSRTVIEKEDAIQCVETEVKSLTSSPIPSPKLYKKSAPPSDKIESVTPSPSVSRRSSFASLFRSKEAIMSPDSPTISGHKRKNTFTGIISDSFRDRSRSRSKSKEREKSLSAAPSSTESIDSKTLHKSVMSLFKSSKKGGKIRSDADTSSNEGLPQFDGIGKVEFKFNNGNETSRSVKKYYETPLEGDSIRIPLHSPTHYEENSILQDWKTSSQDSQETVIEATSRKVNAVVEPVPIPPSSSEFTTVATTTLSSTTTTTTVEVNSIKSNNAAAFSSASTTSDKHQQSRQSSTSSDNVVFSTKLGSNEVFTTKLPKQLKKIPTETDVKEVPKVTSDHKSSTMPSLVGVDDSKKIIPKTKSAQIIREIAEVKTLPEKQQPLVAVKREKRASQISQDSSKRNSVLSTNNEDDRNSSESERDSEFEFPKAKKDLKLNLDVPEPERTGLVLQDSFEEELPYVPTTLPLERSAAVPIIPVKQRSTFEVKTCSIERPRSTTPINPSCLEDYCEEVMGNFDVESVTKTIEKLKISLPRNESFDKSTKISPRKGSNTNWMDFAEKHISTGSRPSPSQTSDTPPPLPPKGVQKDWINFEDIPERRKAPKRIQTIPSRGHIDVPEAVLQDHVVYTYVNPDECKCECHEINARERELREEAAVAPPVQEDELPLLGEEHPEEEKNGTGSRGTRRVKLEAGVVDCRSIISDSSVDLSASAEPPEANGVDASLRTPFTSDLGLSSNRSSIVSQEEPQTPESPNAFPKIF